MLLIIDFLLCMVRELLHLNAAHELKQPTNKYQAVPESQFAIAEPAILGPTAFTGVYKSHL